VKSCEILIEIFKNHKEQMYNLNFEPGLLPIIEILENNMHELWFHQTHPSNRSTFCNRR